MVRSMFQEAVNMGIDGSQSEELTKRIRLTNQVCITIIAICFGFSLLYQALHLIAFSVVWLSVIFLFISILVTNYTNKYHLARYGLITFGNLTIVFFALCLGKSSGIHNFLYAGLAGAFIIFSRGEFWPKVYSITLSFVSLLCIETMVGDPVLLISITQSETIQILQFFNVFSAMLFIILNQYYLFRENAISTERMQKANQQYKQLTEELEKRVEQRTAALQEANQDLSAYNYSISHELRAPLHPIRTMTQLLKGRYAQHISQNAHQILDEIDRSSGQMMQLIEGLLTFSRTGRKQLNKQEVDMEELIKMVYASIKPAEGGEDNIELKMGDLPSAYIDKNMFHHVIQNLLTNAIKYSSDRNPTIIQWEGWETDQEVIFAIHDNGIGFDDSKKQEIFQAFQRLHAKTHYEGSGIGLAITERILRKHNGTIWAESTPGEGSSFYFSLPRHG